MLASLILLPAVFYFTSEGALSAAAEKIFFAGMKDNRTNALPFPPLFTGLSALPGGAAFLALRLLYYLPPAVYLAVGGFGLFRVFRRDRKGVLLVLFALFGAAAFNQTLWRSDLPHLFQSLPPFYALSFFLVDTTLRRYRFIRTPLVLAAPLLMLLVLQQYVTVWNSPNGAGRIAKEGFQPVPPYYTGSVVQIGGPVERLPFEKAGVRVSPEQAAFFAAVGEQLDLYSQPGDYMVTVPGLQMIYFLFDRRNPTGYIHLRRALDNRDEEAQYIRDLVDRPTKMVLLRDFAIDGREERRFRRFAPGITEAIEREFVPVRSIGNLVVYVRRENRIEG